MSEVRGTHPRPSRRRKVLLVILGAAAELLLIEGGIRVVMPHPFYGNMIVPDEKAGFKAKPGTVGRSTNPAAGFDVELRINREGFRDRDFSVQKAANTLRIAFLGDSFTYAEQVEEPETFVRIMEGLLNTDSKRFAGRKVECMNFAISGYDTQQHVLCYEYYVRKYKPDIVVLEMFPHNDFPGNLFYLREKLFGRPHFKLVGGRLEKVEANEKLLQSNYKKVKKETEMTLLRHSHLYNVVAGLFKRFQFRFTSHAKAQAFKLDPNDSASVEKFWNLPYTWSYRYYVVGKDPFNDQTEKITRLLMRKLKDEVEADKSVFLVSLIPAKENVWPERRPEMAKLYPEIESFKFDFNRPFASVHKFFPELVKRRDIFDARPPLRKAGETQQVFFNHEFHLTPAGHRAVADAQAPWLAERIDRLIQSRLELE